MTRAMNLPLHRLPDPGERFLLFLLADGGVDLDDDKVDVLARQSGLTPNAVREAWDKFAELGLIRYDEAERFWDLHLPPIEPEPGFVQLDGFEGY